MKPRDCDASRSGVQGVVHSILRTDKGRVRLDIDNMYGIVLAPRSAQGLARWSTSCHFRERFAIGWVNQLELNLRGQRRTFIIGREKKKEFHEDYSGKVSTLS
jgi:hypothetical protein